MDTDSPALEHLSPDECMRLMGSVAVGRIVYTRQALPAVELVNFALVDGDIVIRTSAEGKLAAATRGAVVAFEADAVEVDGQAGWSVAIVGRRFRAAREPAGGGGVRDVVRVGERVGSARKHSGLSAWVSHL
jgi:uncharacterized protein